MPQKKEENPIVENYRGINIRQYPRVYLRISIYEMKRFIDAKLDFNLPAKEALESGRVKLAECTDISIKKYSNAESN